MAGYEIRLTLYSNTETWRELTVPENITFKQLHDIIQKVFNFDDYHNWCFQIPNEIPEEEVVDLGNIIEEFDSESAETLKLSETADKHNVLLYNYDFGDNWEIIVHFLKIVDYDNKTAVITDYKGKYSPMDDMGGVMVFDEIMAEQDEIEYVLDSYGLTLGDLSKMDFESKYKKGSKILIR